ncbi:MAG: prepilin-type N-terminal cleavage/methylation domain-containing protein [Candidatus Methylomirabilales bacterium]
MKLGEKTSRDRYPAENKGNRDRGLRSKSGFSLIEVLIGATVLAVGLLGLASLYPVAYLNVDSGGKLTEATALTQSFIEQLRTMGTNNFDAMVGDFPANGFDGLDTINCQGDPTCIAWLQAVDVANGGPLPQGRVRVTITCQDPAGNPVPAPPPNDCTPPSQPTWLANITVTVTWTNLRGAGPTVSLMTRVMAGG